MNAPPDCTRCPRLCSSRKRVVNGTGPEDSSILLVGPGPDKSAERVGRPFAGVVSRVEHLLSLAGIDPGDVRMEGITRCRPPRFHVADQPPTAGEIKKCAPYLLEGISKINPFLIITLGAPAWKWFNTEYTLASAHGFMSVWEHPQTRAVIQIVPMYLPSSASPRNPELARVMIHDWRYLGEVLAGRGEVGKEAYLEQRLNMKWVREGPVVLDSGGIIEK